MRFISELLIDPEVGGKFERDPDEALASHGFCRECLAQPVGERKKLAEKGNQRRTG